MPWDLLGEIAKTYGFGALIAVMALAAMGYAVRALWKRNKELSNGPQSKRLGAIENKIKELASTEALRKEYQVITENLREEHAIQVEALRREFTDRLTALQMARQNEIAAYARRLDELQELRVSDGAAAYEKRLSEMKEVVTTVVRSSNENNAATGKISGMMETLIEVLKR